MDQRLRFVSTASVFAAVVLLAAGCGDGEEAGSPGDSAGAGADATIATSSLGKKQYLKRAEAACRRLGRGGLGRIERYAAENEQRSREQLTTGVYRDVVLPVAERQIAALRRLGAPAGDEEVIEAMLVAQEEAADAASRAQRIGSTEEYEDYFADARRMYEDYGFEACAI